MVLNYNKNITITKFKDLNEVSSLTKKYLVKGNIALSGGTTYFKLLNNWSNYNLDLSGINFYPVDERVVDFNSPSSNWGNTYRNFLSKYNKTITNHFVDYKEYDLALSDVVMDTIFLGVGDDGHTASLFNIETVFKHTNSKVISTISPKEPKERISLTGEYIITSKNIVIIFYGEGKENILKKVLNGEVLPITKLLKRVKSGVIYVHDQLLKE